MRDSLGSQLGRRRDYVLYPAPLPAELTLKLPGGAVRNFQQTHS